MTITETDNVAKESNIINVAEIKKQTNFADLAALIRAENLLQKNTPFYIKRVVQITFLSLMAWIGVFLLQDGWWVLFIAPVLGILGAQYGFIVHEAAHRQVFESNKTNKRFALIGANLIVGLSYGWWDKKKHSLHHANPNTVGKDPDIAIRVLSFTKESFDAKKGVEKILTKRQGYLFPFLLLFTGFDLLFESVKSLLVSDDKNKLENRWLELGLIAVRFIVPAIVLFAILNPIAAVLFMIIQMMVFGFFMGGAFAPNHKGMPIIPEGSRVDFLSKQVLTSRDIKGGWLVDNLMGGLNYQVEHHLFPSMPRTNLRRAQQIVKQFCAEKNIPYTETNLFESYMIVMRYLNKVGLKNSDPFDCPLVNQYRTSIK